MKTSKPNTSKSPTAEAEPTWKTEEVETFKVPKTTQVWKTQILTAPDGKEMVGIRKFAAKANGDLQITKAGLTIPNDAIGEKLLRKLAKMLLKLADEVKTRPPV